MSFISKTNQINTIKHYDKLIDENNDPVYDSSELQEYMDKWDGPIFIESMQLSSEKNVLEIGIGTGRLAIKVAPLCGKFEGIDISSKTIERAKENLSEFNNITLFNGDFLKYTFEKKYDVIYSSLVFMHINKKQKAIDKVAKLLAEGGRFVLSIDKNKSRFIDMGNRKVKIYPDDSECIKRYFQKSGLRVVKEFETEFANIIVGEKAR